MLNGSNQIVRFNSQTGATLLTASSNSATTDFSTFVSGVSSATPLDWSNGNTLGSRQVNSLTLDSTGGSGVVFLGGDAASANPGALSITSGALVFQGRPTARPFTAARLAARS